MGTLNDEKKLKLDEKNNNKYTKAIQITKNGKIKK